jgi:hypothetical protein
LPYLFFFMPNDIVESLGQSDISFLEIIGM